ncbi:Negative regulator of differentiation 1 [Colletotrichum siamense]|uniref:Negative regulator of differentiation 1 n=1 Tax=Colletotrichum siamense TaxID=690259 RepID=A0A9P5BVU6_COLSI|nr:Negative regulator of differentiation 1 [Colletotrichum siamense]KAF4850098.1 Negative regulator of differentiation 1 [Colletotrichum siamense]
MVSFVSDTVSIDRSYLDTLIRRAELNTSDPTSCHSTITISRAEHETLLNAAREFANLRRNLMRGGVTEDTLAVLTSDESQCQEDDQKPAGQIPDPSSGGAPDYVHKPCQKITAATRVPNSDCHGGQPSDRGSIKQDWADTEVHEISESCISPTETNHQQGSSHQDKDQKPSRLQFEKSTTRTVLITNLPDGTTHADVTAVIRGGQLLDIFLRTHDRSAQVSFLHSAEAQDFLEHVRRHDLYIKHKRVEVRWSDRQFILPGHVASKIGIGATRNLVIRRCDPNLTEEGVRDDLEHIHNLVVVRVLFRSGSCHIGTNSVHNAMFARTCMMSRFKYKGSRIDWDVDECSQPLEKFQYPRASAHSLSTKRPSGPMANRFQLLHLDDDEEDEDVALLEFQRRPMDIVL